VDDFPRRRQGRSRIQAPARVLFEQARCCTQIFHGKCRFFETTSTREENETKRIARQENDGNPQLSVTRRQDNDLRTYCFVVVRESSSRWI